MARTRSAAALSRPAVPRHPRRVSGPARPAVTRPRPVPVPGQPRARGGRDLVPQPHGTFGAAVRALPDHRLLDTLLRSRAWIWLLGIALGGIVFMQVSLLGMNAGIGRAVAQSTTLEHQNAQLQETVAELSGGDRVRANAARIDLLSPSATDVSFLRYRGRLDARRAADRMIAPSDEARAALGMGGLPATTTTAATTTATAVTPVVTAAPVATAAPVTAVATPVPTAAAPVATAAPPVATTAPTTTTTTTAGGVTASP